MDKDAAFSGEQAAPAFSYGRDRGRAATAPHHIDWNGWKDILWRVWHEFNRDRVMLVAAGATFYLLLAAFPAMAVLVSLFGLVGDPTRIAAQLNLLSGVLPPSAIAFITGQLNSLAEQNHAALTFGFAFSFVVALWSANSGVKTLFEAMNVAYEETEKRSFVRLNLVALVFTLGTMAVGSVFVFAIGVVPAVLALVGLGSATEWIISAARWPVLFVVAAVAISILYRYGPSREPAKWRWITWGGAFATALWLVTAMAFSWYLSNFANYNATYGSLGAMVGFLMWTWVSMLVLIMGAELDAEAEHQTAVDSTTGPAKPMGERGATMADTLGRQRGSPPGASRREAPTASVERRAVTDMTGPVTALACAAMALAAGWYWAQRERGRR